MAARTASREDLTVEFPLDPHHSRLPRTVHAAPSWSAGRQTRPRLEPAAEAGGLALGLEATNR